MIIKKLHHLPIEDNPHKVDVRKLYDREDAQAVHMVLRPGQSLIPHITSVDVFFYVLKGSPDIRVGEVKVTVEKDSLVESPKNIVHCISNQSGSSARILVVKAPKQTGKAILL